MSYRVVDEVLNIQSCSISDLSQATKKEFERQFNGGNVETLTLFYDKNNDVVVLNQDNKNYEIYELTAKAYLGVPDKTRKEIRNRAEEIDKRFSETFDILDEVIKSRIIEQLQKLYQSEFKMIGKQTDYWNQWDIIQAIDVVNNSQCIKLVSAYNWGYIQGKRSERSRRKNNLRGKSVRLP